MRFRHNGHLHEDMWRERGSSEDYEWSLDLINYGTEEIAVSGIRLKQSEMDAGVMSVAEYVADWLEKLRAYLQVQPVEFREQVTASMQEQYRQILLDAGVEILE